MPFYKVRIMGNFSCKVQVEAVNEDEAIERADELLYGNSDIDLYDYEHDVNLVSDPHSPGSYYIKYHLPGAPRVSAMACMAHDPADAGMQCLSAQPSATIVSIKRQ